MQLPWRQANFHDFLYPLYPSTEDDRWMIPAEETAYRLPLQMATTRQIGKV